MIISMKLEGQKWFPGEPLCALLFWPENVCYGLSFCNELLMYCVCHRLSQSRWVIPLLRVIQCLLHLYVSFSNVNLVGLYEIRLANIVLPISKTDKPIGVDAQRGFPCSWVAIPWQVSKMTSVSFSSSHVSCSPLVPPTL